MSAKKDILILCDWFLPGYLAGGPIQSIATLTEKLGSDFNFKIITSDRDFKSKQSYPNIKANEWTVFEGRAVFYISPNNMNSDFILKLILSTKHEVIYLNSLFSKQFTIGPLRWKQQGKISADIILAPRGMLGDGAIAIKPLKKHVFLRFAKWFGWFQNIIWQSTSEQESFEIKKRIGLNSHIKQASNFPNSDSYFKPIQKKEGHLKLCFISRISEKKNLNFAMDVLKLVNSVDLVFDVYGPIEDEEYWNLCQENAKQLPANVSYHYKGVLKPSEIGQVVSEYHALLLPTQNENYGHIIVETLQHARPIIISDQTPWRHLQSEQVGFDIDLLHKEKFIESIQSLSSMNQTDFDKVCERCYNYIHQKLNAEEIRKQYLNLF